MADPNIRKKIVDTCWKLNRLHLNQGTSGNISVRFDDDFLITPSGVDYDSMLPSDIVEMDFEGGYRGTRIPSSEWRLHHDILRTHRDVHAVIHTHSMFCTTLAIHGLSIPAMHYMVAVAGGNDIPCVPYAPPTTQALSDAVLPTLAKRKACLMAHHGVVVTGATLKKTLALLIEVETLAAQYWRTLQIGTPPLLSEQDMRKVHEIMKTYGKKKSRKLHRM